jgi:hypothetical protein
LAALAQFNPEAALTAGVTQEAALQQIGAKANLGRTTLITDATANSLGLDTTQGQKYQQDARGGLSLIQQGKPPQPLGSSFQALAGNRVLALFNKPNRTDTETQEMNFLNEQLKRPRVYTTQNPDGSSQQIKDPGFDALNFLQGGQATTTITETSDQAQQQDGQQTGPEVIGEKKPKLTEQEASYVSDAASAINDLETVINIMFGGDLYSGDYNQAVSVASGNAVGRAASGEAQRLSDALNNLIDLRLRKRTGATANIDEIRNYQNAVFPSIVTREDTMRDRIIRLIKEFNTNLEVFKGGRNIDLPTLKLPEPPKQNATNSVEITLPGTN